MIVLYVLLALLVFSIMIFVHELGHYLLSLFDEYNYFSWNEKKNKYEWLDCKRPKDAPFRAFSVSESFFVRCRDTF